MIRGAESCAERIREADAAHGRGVAARWCGLEHDFLNVGQATTYSAIVTLFPGLIIAAAVVGLLPGCPPAAVAAGDALRSDILPTVEAAARCVFPDHAPQSAVDARDDRVDPGERDRRDQRDVAADGGVPANGCNSPMILAFWRGGGDPLVLVALSLVPFAIASALVAFGHLLTIWLTMHVVQQARPTFFLVALSVRWGIALAGSVASIAVIYHAGAPMRIVIGPIRACGRGSGCCRERRWQLALWFLSTLGFGLYVTLCELLRCMARWAQALRCWCGCISWRSACCMAQSSMRSWRWDGWATPIHAIRCRSRLG